MKEIRNINYNNPQSHLNLVNQIFEIEQKTKDIKEKNSILRNINKLKVILEDSFGLSYHNPLGESYSDTRTDCEATIAGANVDNLEIVEVIQPIIFSSYKNIEHVIKVIVQPAVVIVHSKTH
ncbi:MAG: hypothetical protein WCK32_00105 [Chlorobiaceae bacterium]